MRDFFFFFYYPQLFVCSDFLYHDKEKQHIYKSNSDNFSNVIKFLYDYYVAITFNLGVEFHKGCSTVYFLRILLMK